MELRVVETLFPPTLEPTRETVPTNRLEILGPLSERERLLVCCVAVAIQELEGDQPSGEGALRVLRKAFADSAGVAWNSAMWEA